MHCSVALTALLPLLAYNVVAHMEMSSPFPIDSNLNPAVPENLKDYSYTSPLDASGANFPCKGYQNQRPELITANYTAGSTHTMTFAGSATHGGGSCQISLSYDNGATFRVIKSIIGGCPLPKQYDFTIPSYAPTGNALLAWTWYNLVGNRELYMDCAQIDVGSGSAMRGSAKRSTKHRARDTFSSFDQLPYIWKANIEGLNTCSTTEGVNPVFPNPGPDVEYGDGMSASSPVSSGSCENPSPPGQAYKDIPTLGGGAGFNDGKSFAVSSMLATSAPAPASSSLPSSTAVLSSSSTPTIIASSSTIAVATSAAFSNPIATASSEPTAVLPTSIAVTSAPMPSATASTPPSGGSNNLPFAPSPPSAEYLPCLPGAFLCTSSTTWAQCVVGGSYTAMGSVAAGMMCSPMSVSNDGIFGELASGGGASGTHRNDAIVRAT